MMQFDTFLEEYGQKMPNFCPFLEWGNPIKTRNEAI